MFEHYIRLQKDFSTEWPGPNGDEIRLSNKHLSLIVYPNDGCRIKSLKAFGMEVLREWDDQKKAFQYGCFPMVPWVGRIENGNFNFDGKNYQLHQNKGKHAMHGMACMKNWEVVYTTKTKALFKLELESLWPFAGVVLQEMQIIENKVIMKLSIISHKDIFPASAGWHPWFKKQLSSYSNTDLLVKFQADWQEEPGNNEVPTGNRILPNSGPWDDTFGFNDTVAATLYWGSKLKMNVSSTGNYLTVFDKLQDATCVNTMTDRPNGLNGYSVQVVTPEQPLEIQTILDFNIG